MNKNNNDQSSSLTQCVFVPELKLFKILHHRGKIIHKFGISVDPKILDLEDNDIFVKEQRAVSSNSFCEDDGLLKKEVNKYKSKVQDYLFAEEVLYLHQLGLIQVLPIDENNDNKNDKGIIALSTKDLFRMCLSSSESKSLIPLPIYLTYVHLRSQSYIVYRHGLLKYDEEKVNGQQCNNEDDNYRKNEPVNENKEAWIQDQQLKQFKERKRRAIHATSTSTTMLFHPNTIAFDVYLPGRSQKFRKSDPGPPDFMVAVASFHEHKPFRDIQQMMKICRGVSLKFATVSETGTVVMFGLNDDKVPILGEEK